MWKYCVARVLYRSRRIAFPLHDWFHAWMNVRGLCLPNVYDSFLQRAGTVGFAPILLEAIHGGTMASL